MLQYFYKNKSLLNQLPNIITIIRLLLSLVFIYLFTQGTDNYISALIVFAIATVSDALDGWLARKLNTTSKFGENLDPIADKFLTISAFLAFAMQGIVEYWCVIIIIIRDIINTVMRFMFFTEHKIPTSKSAKFKTAIQLIFILYILFLQVLATNYSNLTAQQMLYSPITYFIMLGITALTVWTLIEYIMHLTSVKKI